ncbi:MAG TPA: LuxR C-terminal-related transcriptional regulator [Polyangiaceae bacterium]|jgi:DNA-binding CsgD family transcriptional regulator
MTSAGDEGPLALPQLPEQLTAQQLWRDLIAGRATVSAHRDEGGRRYLTLELAAPGSSNQLELLTERERRAVGFRAFGQTLKFIAHELGVSQPTVARTLANARQKLGLASDLDLPAIFAASPRSKRRV